MPQDALWYVVHTYSGYENKVKANIEKIVENQGMEDQIIEVVVPMLDSMEIKNGQKKLVQKKVYPGYVLIKMFMNDDTWYVVRNTRGVTSFVGPGSKPVALTEDEVAVMGIDGNLVEDNTENIDFDLGDVLMVNQGPFANATGIVQEINHTKNSVILKLSVFGRETPVELDFNQVSQVDYSDN